MNVDNVALLLLGLAGNAFGGCNALNVTVILPFVFPLPLAFVSIVSGMADNNV
jgi:hypothetical protein